MALISCDVIIVQHLAHNILHCESCGFRTVLIIGGVISLTFQYAFVCMPWIYSYVYMYNLRNNSARIQRF